MGVVGYHRPGSAAEAAALAAAPAARFLAGGLTLVADLRERRAGPVEILIDLTRIAELAGITEADGGAAIGALSTHARLAADPVLHRLVPALAWLAGRVGDPQVRNRGTIGGAIAAPDPSGDYPAALIALDAAIRTDRRTIPASDFFTTGFGTAMAQGEVIVAIALPATPVAAYAKISRAASRHALVGVFVARTRGGVRVTATGAGRDTYLRLPAIERTLDAAFTPEAAAAVEVAADGLLDDLHGSAAYRAHLVRVLASRAVRDCLQPAP